MGEDESWDGQGTAFVRHDNMALSDCQFHCEMTLYCVGVEYSSGDKRCELWTSRINHTVFAEGYECIVRDDSFTAKDHLADRISNRMLSTSTASTTPLSSTAPIFHRSGWAG